MFQRAEASLGRTQNLNPMVKVTASTAPVGDHPDEYFFDFDVICATKCPTDQLIRLDNICCKKGIKFFCGDVFGFFGYTFADLQTHEFAELVFPFEIHLILASCLFILGSCIPFFLFFFFSER